MNVQIHLCTTVTMSALIPQPALCAPAALATA